MPYSTRMIHVGEVSRIRFTLDDKNLVSVGRYDRTVMIMLALE